MSRPQAFGKLLMVCVSTTVALYGAEIFLYVDPLRLSPLHPPARFDERGYLQVVRDLRASGTPAYAGTSIRSWFPLPPSVHDTPVIPLAGVPHATIVLCIESGDYVLYESDRFGFNAPDAQWDLRAEVALVGDSFVEGWCVPRGDTFGGIIRRAVPATLNVGYAGHGPLAELGTIREYVATHRPAHVFWFFYEGNDLTFDLPEEMENPLLRQYLMPGFTQHLRERATLVGEEMRRKFDARLASSTPPAPARPLVEIAKLRSARTLARNALVRPSPRDSSFALGDLRRILTEARRTVGEWDGALHFVYLPDFTSATGGGNAADHDRIVAVAIDLGLNVIDLFSDFRNHPDPRSLFPYKEGRHLVRSSRGVHYNRDGHHLVAQRILEVIQKY